LALPMCVCFLFFDHLFCFLIQWASQAYLAFSIMPPTFSFNLQPNLVKPSFGRLQLTYFRNWFFEKRKKSTDSSAQWG
jgi:hypothetical protein